MLSDAHVKCDECDWILSVKPEEVLDWHNKCCPVCGAIIVNDAEFRAFRVLLAISRFSDWCNRVYKFFTGKEVEMHVTHIDSVKWR